MTQTYKSRIRIAAEQGDLNALAGLVNEGAVGSRILANDELAELVQAIHKVARRKRIEAIAGWVVIAALAAAVVVLA